MAQHTKHTSLSRQVYYSFEAPKDTVGFDEPEAERVLKEAVEDGIVTNYDTGRGYIVWWNGFPGEDMRRIKKRLKQIVDASKPRSDYGV